MIQVAESTFYNTQLESVYGTLFKGSCENDKCESLNATQLLPSIIANLIEETSRKDEDVYVVSPDPECLIFELEQYQQRLIVSPGMLFGPCNTRCAKYQLHLARIEAEARMSAPT